MTQTSVYRIEPRESNTASASDVTNFVTPDGLWDLKTFRIQFLADIIGSSSGQCALPRNTASFIESMSIFINDVEVQHIASYNRLVRIMTDYNRKNTTQNVLDQDEYIGNTATASPLYDVSSVPCCVSDFLGILETDAVVRGSIRIQVFWAPDAILIRDSAAAVYKLSAMHAVITRGEQPSPRIMFDHWVSQYQYNQTYNQQTMISVESNDIEYVIGTFIASDYDTYVSTEATAGTSWYFAHGTGEVTKDQKIDVSFSCNQTALCAGPIYYQFAPEHLRDFLPGERRVEYPAALTRDGTVSTRTLEEVMCYQWVAGLPVMLKGSTRPAMIVFETRGGLGPAGQNSYPNFSIVYVKTNPVLEMDDDGNYTLIK